MMDIRSKVTRNGQITVPKPIRERFDVQEGDEVAFEIRDDHVVLRFLDTNRLSAEDAEAIKWGLDQLLRGEAVEYRSGMYGETDVESHGS